MKAIIVLALYWQPFEFALYIGFKANPRRKRASLCCFCFDSSYLKSL